MAVKSARSKARPERGRKTINAEAALIAANSYCLFHFPTLYTGGIPRRLSVPPGEFWIVPIVLTSPGHGIVGEVGVLAVDAKSGNVVGSSTREEVLAAGKHLREEKGDALEAAFRRARAT